MRADGYRLSAFFRMGAAFPASAPGRHPQGAFRGLRKLHPRYGLPSCAPTFPGALSRGSAPASFPTEPLASYRI
jgi:hypothetical protein